MAVTDGRTRPPTLLLGYDPANLADLAALPGRAAVYSPTAGPVKAARKDAAGHAFHAAARRQSGLDDPAEAAKAKAEAEAAAAAAAAGKESPIPASPGDSDTGFEHKKKKKKKGEEQDVDFYALLGLETERWLATEQQIKDAYRVAALKSHPDKCGAAMATPEVKEALEERFRNVQKAYEVLSDADKRRTYDSTSDQDFDDSLPEACAPSEFYKVFGAAFKRQAKWAAVTPVPTAGWIEEAAWADVEGFYDYWFQFKSWREFPHEDEEDLDQAESREHKRWMERANSKLREKAKKEETRRIRTFVEAAYRSDPRVARRKEEEKASKAKAKEAKYADKRREAEEKARAEAEAKAAAEASAVAERERAATEKKEREEEKKRVRKAKARVRAAAADAIDGAELSAEQVEDMCSALEGLAVRTLADELDAAATPAARLARLMEGMAAAEAVRQAASGGASPGPSGGGDGTGSTAPGASPAKPAAAPWGDEELRLLEKALVKFPKGVLRRWEQVTAYIASRSLDEVLAQVKARMSTEAAAAANKQGDAFARFQKEMGKKKAAGGLELPPEDSRQNTFSDVEVNLVGEAASALGGAAAAAPAASDWSEVQEMALIKALKAFPKGSADSEKARWARISAAVPGRTAQQCFKRFGEIRDQLKKKKEGGADGKEGAAE